MRNYFHNLAIWLIGWTRLGDLHYKPGWGPWKFAPAYLLDVGLNVLTGGAVGTISRRAQFHRRGWFWDKLLDAIEKFDRDHGPRSGPDLFDTEECHPLVQVAVTAFWILAVWLI